MIEPADRNFWVTHAHRMAKPVLTALSQQRLKATMPVESVGAHRAAWSHLECFARVMAGIAPWLASDASEVERRELAALAVPSLDHATDPASADFMNFSDGTQPLVDAAFLAQAILRAPDLLWHALDRRIQQNVIAAMIATRPIKPYPSNWLLFSAMIEAFFAFIGEPWEAVRVDHAIQQHEQWYKGDGAYGDGPAFHWDYYNSFVIHPMLLEVLDVVNQHGNDWQPLTERMQIRAVRMAAVLERLIGPDGSFPPIGRSIAYRGGAFHLLAMIAWRRELPETLPPEQVRTALTVVLRRTMEPPDTYDPDGWLRIGLCGHQPSIGEPYISTGSLYLASTLFLPLALPLSDSFWSADPQPFTGQRIWQGDDVPSDKSI